MYPYTPKITHAAVTTFILVIFVILGGYTRNERVTLALNIGAFIFAVITAVILGLLILEAYNRRVEVMVEWMTAFAKLDDEARAAVAFTFPTMRYRMKRGEVREFFEDTNVPMETFRLFLQTSNEKYISPRRDWCTKDHPEWAWVEIKAWLETNGYVHPDSAAGNVSWLWVGNSYRHLFAYWMSGRKMVNLSEESYQE